MTLAGATSGLPLAQRGCLSFQAVHTLVFGFVNEPTVAQF